VIDIQIWWDFTNSGARYPQEINLQQLQNHESISLHHFSPIYSKNGMDSILTGNCNDQERQIAQKWRQ